MLSGTETWPGMMGTDDVSTPDDPTNLSSVSGWSAGKLRACRRFMGLQIHQTSDNYFFPCGTPDQQNRPVYELQPADPTEPAFVRRRWRSHQ